MSTDISDEQIQAVWREHSGITVRSIEHAMALSRAVLALAAPAVSGGSMSTNPNSAAPRELGMGLDDFGLKAPEPDNLRKAAQAIVAVHSQAFLFPDEIKNAVRALEAALAAPAVPKECWPSYIAGIIETYLQSNPKAGVRERAIAGIIERRMWLAAPAVPEPHRGICRDDACEQCAVVHPDCSDRCQRPDGWICGGDCRYAAPAVPRPMTADEHAVTRAAIWDSAEVVHPGVPAAQSADAVDALRRLVFDIRALIDSSDGVAGLHQNGDLAPWGDLIEGGAYQSWLGDALGEADATLSQSAAPAAAVPEGYKLVLVSDEDAPGEPDWEECKRQAEVATGLKVEQHTFSILKREVRRWIAHTSQPAAAEELPKAIDLAIMLWAMAQGPQPIEDATEAMAQLIRKHTNKL